MSPLLSVPDFTHLLEPLLLRRDDSVFSNSSISLSATPTLVSSLSRTFSSTDFDSQDESGGEDDWLSGSKASRSRKTETCPSSLLSRALCTLAFSETEPCVAIDDDSEELRGKERHSVKAPRAPRRQKAGLPYRLPDSLATDRLSADHSALPTVRASLGHTSSQDFVEDCTARETTPPSFIDLSMLSPAFLYALPTPEADEKPTLRKRCSSSPLHSPTYPSAPLLRGTNAPFLTPEEQRSAGGLYSPSTEPSAQPPKSLPTPLKRNPPYLRLLCPTDIHHSPPILPGQFPSPDGEEYSFFTSSAPRLTEVPPSPLRSPNDALRLSLGSKFGPHGLFLCRSSSSLARKSAASPIPPGLIGSSHLRRLDRQPKMPPSVYAHEAVVPAPVLVPSPELGPAIVQRLEVIEEEPFVPHIVVSDVVSLSPLYFMTTGSETLRIHRTTTE